MCKFLKYDTTIQNNQSYKKQYDSKYSSVFLVLLNLGTENENINHDADDLRKQFYGISE